MKRSTISVIALFCVMFLFSETSHAASPFGKWKTVPAFTKGVPIAFNLNRCEYRLILDYTSPFLQAPARLYFPQLDAASVPQRAVTVVRFALDRSLILNQEGIGTLFNSTSLGRIQSYYSGGDEQAVNQVLTVDSLGNLGVSIDYNGANGSLITGETAQTKTGLSLQQRCQ